MINHDSASSPDSSTTGSTGSDSKTYLRGQNIPVDAQVLQEREARRQRGLELQNAIKQQLEEKDRQRKAERERKLREERDEEERIKRERDREKERSYTHEIKLYPICPIAHNFLKIFCVMFIAIQLISELIFYFNRFEEEQKRIREKEFAQLKKEEAMREILEAAERKAKEEKRQRMRQREEPKTERENSSERIFESNCWKSPSTDRPIECASQSIVSEPIVDNLTENFPGDNFIESNVKKNCDKKQTTSETFDDRKIVKEDCYRIEIKEENTVRLPVGKEVAIVLSGRLENPDFLNRANLQLVNLVMSPSPRINDKCSTSVINSGLNALVKSLANPVHLRKSPISPISPRLVENRVLTPSKYRNSLGASQGRDFGTQTDGESELQESGSKDSSIKDCKDVVNHNRRDVEK